MQPWDLGRKCSHLLEVPYPTARDSPPPNTWSPEGRSRVACPTLTSHRGWMWLAWGQEQRTLRSETIPVSHLPARSADRGATKGWDSARGLNQEYEKGMTRDERKREMKQLFEAKPHLSSVATQSGLQWNRGTSLSLHQCQKAPLAVRCCHLYCLCVPRRSIHRPR